jgi:hypothetical protein
VPALIAGAAVLLVVLLVGTGALISFLAPRIQAARAAMLRTACAANLRRIADAMRKYHQEWECFPPAHLADGSGAPTHSWRVLLLPYLGERALYEQYRFDEPWNGPNNRTLVDRMPPVFRCPADQSKHPGKTHYSMLIGPNTVSNGTSVTRLSDIVDGPSRTILLIEGSDFTVEWLEPRDLAWDAAHLDLGGSQVTGGFGPANLVRHEEGTNAAMCDGTERWIKSWVAPPVFQAMTTISGGEPY